MKKLSIAFLWHQHQPMYKNPSNGMYELPWVRLHATKDYYDTVAILDEFPAIQATFNMVPSLLMQLSEYAQGIARDRYLDLTLQSSTNLTIDDKIFILHNFFMANWDTMIDPYPRYKQLLDKRGRNTTDSELKRIQSYFKAQDFLDLQVWFNLSWMDPYWRTNDALIKTLYAKGRDFTEEEKHALIKKQLEICGLVVKKYRDMQDQGRIEVSTTPFYHPILPLLADTNNALGSTPQITLPQKRFQHREDAKTQIMKAVEYYTSAFGRPPRGMWPSEGSVADDVIPLFPEAGIQWIATDEAILFRSDPSKPRKKLYQPYLLDVMGNKVNIVFRDHELSDAIGFVYTRWNAEAAVADFMKKIHYIQELTADLPYDPLVSIILDGENCWEYYANDGWDFLRLLYKTISETSSLRTTTISGFLENNPPIDTLHKIWPGSWINGNYGIWIGHTEDNLAWNYLADTRKFLTTYITAHPEKKDSPEVKAAWEQIYIAEGSDWNWWYGDDHSSGNDQMFDYLFRQNLISVYELLKEKAPDHLYKAIKGIMCKRPTLEPIDFISPTIDGLVSSYFEWQPAGFYQVGHAGGSMHQVATIVNAFYYGFDLQNLYCRVDLNLPLKSAEIADLCFKLAFLMPKERDASVCVEPGGKIKEYILSTPQGKEQLTTAAAQKILEFAIPIEKLSLPADCSSLEFCLVVLRNNLEVERWPYASSVVIPKPSEDFILKNWSV
ncbi:MAG: hypothetical protein A2293_00415 [Elusimicrobia bacterium RIFOXYB2_FULL_49_7]|nr:MAG: hypothetical protein A2293_00415 [Elusimicrobia bacterium RIFOXYB2_FULL_49_7]